MTFESAEAVIRAVTSRSLSEHPLVHRIARSQDAGLLWLLIYNTYRGTSVHFAAWLAAVTATVDDERARSLLARQLNEELGDGNVERAHSRLMLDFLAAIEPLRPAGLSPSMTEPGLELGEALKQHYRACDQYEAMAALMAGEVCAHQLIASVGRLLTPHLHRIDQTKITWLTHHNEVEGGHADESLELARFVPATPTAVESVVKGAFGLHGAIWCSMDALLSLSPERT
jgi:pyrroloquinoline quinone (PQQ) biosynthesis protein C